MLKHNKPQIVLDLDDFCEEIMTNELWGLIFGLKQKLPLLKITMFTIPELCSQEWVSYVKSLGWIEMHYHGSAHLNRDEWFERKDIHHQNWDGFFKGFKAPWWRMDQTTADLFDSAGYLISAKKGYFDVKGKRVYRFNEGTEIIPNVCYQNEQYLAVHSHVQSQRLGDGLPDLYDSIFNILLKNDGFLFVSEVV